MASKRLSAFQQASPKPQQQKSAKFASRKILARNEGPSILTYKTPGRGQNGESSN